jgi:hypothetical protein
MTGNLVLPPKPVLPPHMLETIRDECRRVGGLLFQRYGWRFAVYAPRGTGGRKGLPVHLRWFVRKYDAEECPGLLRMLMDLPKAGDPPPIRNRRF